MKKIGRNRPRVRIDLKPREKNVGLNLRPKIPNNA